MKMKTFVLALTLALVIGLGILDLVVSGQGATPAASAGVAATTLAAVAPPEITGNLPSGCWAPGDLVGESDPATTRATLCGAASP